MRNIKLWTKDEMDELRAIVRAGKTNEQIAAKLGRTKSAVAHKRSQLFKLIPEETEPVTAEPEDIEEDPDGEGGTEIERELYYVQELLDEAVKTINANADILDEATKAINANAGILEKNMATMMERTNELSKEKTVHEDEIAELKQRAGYMAENLWQIDAYLSRGPLYRLFHSFRKFREGFSDGKRKS